MKYIAITWKEDRFVHCVPETFPVLEEFENFMREMGVEDPNINHIYIIRQTKENEELIKLLPTLPYLYVFEVLYCPVCEHFDVLEGFKDGEHIEHDNGWLKDWEAFIIR